MTEPLTCKDFVGDCCQLCHDLDVNERDNLEDVLDKEDNLYARVCCCKLGQAELRRNMIMEPINENQTS